MIRALITLLSCASLSWGALSAKAGSFAQATGTGNQATTGVGFTPKVVMFWYNNLTADGGGAGAATGFGAAVSTTQRVSGFSISQDAVGTSNLDRVLSQTKAINIISSAQAVLGAADLVSLDSDGFTLNWSTTDSVPRIINYLALGGSDVTNAKVGSFTASGTSNQAITGVGFQPDVVIEYFTNNAAAAAAGFNSAIGVATATGSWAITAAGADSSNLALVKRYQRTGKSFVVLTGSAGTLNTECTLVSMDTDGYTRICSTQGSLLTNYIAIKGGLFKVGSFSQATSTGNQATTGIGHQPAALLLASYNTATQTTIQANARGSWGAGSSSSSRWAVWHGDTDGANVTVTSKSLDRTKIITLMTEAGASPTTQAAADLVSLDSDGFTLNWTTADATAREVLYFSAGNTAAATTVLQRRIIVQ